jgi:hypothetical protein
MNDDFLDMPIPEGLIDLRAYAGRHTVKIPPELASGHGYKVDFHLHVDLPDKNLIYGREQTLPHLPSAGDVFQCSAARFCVSGALCYDLDRCVFVAKSFLKDTRTSEEVADMLSREGWRMISEDVE